MSIITWFQMMVEMGRRNKYKRSDQKKGYPLRDKDIYNDRKDNRKKNFRDTIGKQGKSRGRRHFDY